MKSRFQYAYSISVFLGVLITAYMMMNRDQSPRNSLAGVPQTSLRSEAGVSDPAVETLIEIEQALTKHRKDRVEKRVPTTQPAE